MTEELYNKIDEFQNETDWSKYPTYEHALEEFIKGIVAEETKELNKKLSQAEADYDKMFWQKNEIISNLQEQIESSKWQTGEPIKGREIFARNIANCNLLAIYYSGAWRNAWNGAVIDFNKITMWRYTGFKKQW